MHISKRREAQQENKQSDKVANKFWEEDISLPSAPKGKSEGGGRQLGTCSGAALLNMLESVGSQGDTKLPYKWLLLEENTDLLQRPLEKETGKHP